MLDHLLDPDVPKPETEYDCPECKGPMTKCNRVGYIECKECEVSYSLFADYPDDNDFDYFAVATEFMNDWRIHV